RASTLPNLRVPSNIPGCAAQGPTHVHRNTSTTDDVCTRVGDGGAIRQLPCNTGATRFIEPARAGSMSVQSTMHQLGINEHLGEYTVCASSTPARQPFG